MTWADLCMCDDILTVQNGMDPLFNPQLVFFPFCQYTSMYFIAVSHHTQRFSAKGFPFQHLIGLSSFPVIWSLWGHQLSILTLNLHLCRKRAYFLTAQNSLKIGFVWMGFKQKNIYMQPSLFSTQSVFLSPTPRTLQSCNINITKGTDGEVGMW